MKTNNKKLAKRKEALPILALAFRNYSFTARAAILGG